MGAGAGRAALTLFPVHNSPCALAPLLRSAPPGLSPRIARPLPPLTVFPIPPALPIHPHPAGKRHNKTHTLCRRCGRVAFHIQKSKCGACGYPAARLRNCECLNGREGGGVRGACGAVGQVGAGGMGQACRCTRPCPGSARVPAAEEDVREAGDSPPSLALSLLPSPLLAHSHHPLSPVFSPVPTRMTDNWSVKSLRRKTTGTGRMRYLKDLPRRAKNGFREGTEATPKAAA